MPQPTTEWRKEKEVNTLHALSPSTELDYEPAARQFHRLNSAMTPARKTVVYELCHFPHCRCLAGGARWTSAFALREVAFVLEISAVIF